MPLPQSACLLSGGAGGCERFRRLAELLPHFAAAGVERGEAGGRYGQPRPLLAQRFVCAGQIAAHALQFRCKAVADLLRLRLLALFPFQRHGRLFQ